MEDSIRQLLFVHTKVSVNASIFLFKIAITTYRLGLQIYTKGFNVKTLN